MTSAAAALEAAPMEQEFLEPGRLDTELARSPDAGFDHPPIDAERSGSWEGCPYLARLAIQNPELAAAEARRYYDNQAAEAEAAKKDRSSEAATNEESFWESLEADLGLSDSKPDHALPAPPPTVLTPATAVETMTIPPHEPVPQELVRPPSPAEETGVLPELHPLLPEIAAASAIEPAAIPQPVHREAPSAKAKAEPVNESTVVAVSTVEESAERSESPQTDKSPALVDNVAPTYPSIRHAEIEPAPLQETPAAAPLDLPVVESAPAASLLHDTVPDVLEPAPVRRFAPEVPEVIETYCELEALLQARPQPQQLVESDRCTDSELPDLLPPIAHETDDPPEVAVVLAGVFADIPAAKEDKIEATPAELRTILSAIAAELPACYSSPDMETTASPVHITPELTEQLLTLMRALGYEQPQQPLVGYVEKYGAEQLLQLFRQVCTRYLNNDDYGKRELLMPMQSALATDDDIYARVGRMLLAAAALLRRSMAYN